MVAYSLCPFTALFACLTLAPANHPCIPVPACFHYLFSVAAETTVYPPPRSAEQKYSSKHHAQSSGCICARVSLGWSERGVVGSQVYWTPCPMTHKFLVSSMTPDMAFMTNLLKPDLLCVSRNICEVSVVSCPRVFFLKNQWEGPAGARSQLYIFLQECPCVKPTHPSSVRNSDSARYGWMFSEVIVPMSILTSSAKNVLSLPKHNTLRLCAA